MKIVAGRRMDGRKSKALQSVLADLKRLPLPTVGLSLESKINKMDEMQTRIYIYEKSVTHNSHWYQQPRLCCIVFHLSLKVDRLRTLGSRLGSSPLLSSQGACVLRSQ